MHFVMDTPQGKVEYDTKEGKEPEGPIGKMLVPILKSMAGAEFTLTMDARGKLSNVKVPQKVLDATKSIPGVPGMGGMFNEDSLKQMTSQASLVLPAEPATKGTTWNQKVETKMPFGTMKVDNECSFVGAVTRDGKQLQEISLKPKMTMEPAPNAPASIKIKDQDAQGKALFDNEAGHLTETNLKQNMTMEIGAGNMNFTQKIEQNVLMKLRSEKKE